MDTETNIERVKRLVAEDQSRKVSEIRAGWQQFPERKEAFLAEIHQRNREDIVEGFLEGWWELDDDGNMSAPPMKFKISDFPENAQMAHVVAAAGIFPSVSQARKNGHDKPLVAGEFVLTKKKIRIIVVE